MNQCLLIMMNALRVGASASDTVDASRTAGRGFADGGREDALAGLGSAFSTRAGQCLPRSGELVLGGDHHGVDAGPGIQRWRRLHPQDASGAAEGG
jgi:hypothetical protein